MNIYQKSLNILFSTVLLFNNAYAINISVKSDNTSLKANVINKTKDGELRGIEGKLINPKAIPVSVNQNKLGHTNTYMIDRVEVIDSVTNTKETIIQDYSPAAVRSNTLTTDELLYHIEDKKANKVGSSIKGMLGNSSTEDIYDTTVYNVKGTDVKELSETTYTNIAKVYSTTKSSIEKDITFNMAEKYADVKNATYTCKSNLYKVMDKVRINTRTRTYDLNVNHTYSTATKKDASKITSSRDMSGNIYTYAKGNILSNNKVIGTVDFLNNSKVCVRYINKNTAATACGGDFKLNNNGICEKEDTSEDIRRKHDYYTCKSPVKNKSGKDVILVSNSKVVNFENTITESCDNLPKNNDRMFYKSFGKPMCVNEYKDVIGIDKPKYYTLTNETAIANFKESGCIWNVVNNYKLNMQSKLTDAAIYSTSGSDDVKVGAQDLLEIGKEYAFVLITSGEAKLLSNNGVTRKATFSDSAAANSTITYKGRPFSVLMDTAKTTVANDYESYTYTDLIENPSYADIIKNDFDVQKREIEDLMDTTNFDTNRIYQMNTLTKRATIYLSGYFTTAGKIYKTGEQYMDENNVPRKTASGIDYTKDTYYDTTKKILLDRKNKNVYYFEANDNIDGNIEGQVTFTKIVLQDTFKYTGGNLTLIKKPAGNWNYKLLIFDVNTMKKTYEYIKSTYYSNNNTVKSSFTFHDRTDTNVDISTCSNYDVLYNTCNGNRLMHTNKANKTYLFQQDITQAVCDNSKVGAVLSEGCKVSANLYQTAVGQPQIVKNSDKCLSLFKYDNSNPNIKAILDTLNSKTKIIPNLNNKYLSYISNTGFDKRMLEMRNNAVLFVTELDNTQKLLLSVLSSNYNINTDEGKIEIKKYVDIYDSQVTLIADLKTMIDNMSNKLSTFISMASVTDNDAKNIIKEIASKKITTSKLVQDKMNEVLISINDTIDMLEEESIYGDEYTIVSDLLYTTKDYLEKDFYLDVLQYNAERDKEEFFVEDVFANYDYQTGNRILTRKDIYGQELIFDALQQTNIIYKTVVYPKTCKIGDQIIDCNDKILNSTNVCELVEKEPKTSCLSGYSYIGGGLCAKEACSPGYYFGSTTLNGVKFKGCVKSETGSKGCESDKNGSSYIKYIMKYNKSNKLMCYSLPIFPDIQMGAIAVSAKLKGTFGFDGHTKPTGLNISSLSHQFNETTNSFDLKKLDGVLTINNSEKAYFYWKPGENYLVWNSNSSNIQGMGEYVGHDVSFGVNNAGSGYSNANRKGYTTPSTGYCSKVSATQKYSSVCSTYGTKPFGVSNCSELSGIYTKNVCKNIQNSMYSHSLKVQTDGKPNGSDGHHYMYYVTRYAASDLFADLKATSLNMIFTCKSLGNGAKVIMQPKEQPNNTMSKTLTNFNIKSIPSSSLPAWCVNVKPLDGCTNNIQEYGDCTNNGQYIVSNNASKYCYITRPKLSNSCKSVMYEIPVKTTAECNTFNNFHNVGGECKRITYNDAIHNTDYYCTLIPSKFNPFGEKNNGNEESYKNIANNHNKILKSGKAMSFDIAIDSVSITTDISYNQNNSTHILTHDTTMLSEADAYNTNYYKTKISPENRLMAPRINIHKYAGKTYNYVNHSSTKFRGFLLNKSINYNFNYNRSDEEFFYQKNLFNVHLEDETYEYSNVVGSTTMDNRFGFIKNKFVDNTPANATKNNKAYKCNYKYTVFQLPNCNSGIVNSAEKEEFTLSYDYQNNFFTCQSVAQANCPTNYTYNSYLKKCIEEKERFSCPTEYSDNGQTYRKSAGEIIESASTNTSVSCRLKKQSCGNKSIEAKCPFGFKYDSSTKGSVLNACVLDLSAVNGITVEEVDLLKNILNGTTTLKTVNVCPVYKKDAVIQNFHKTIQVSPTWNLSSDEKTCSTIEYERITTTVKTAHVKYALNNSISVGKTFGKAFNLLSKETFKNNTTGKTASEFLKEGYKTASNNNRLIIPVLIYPDNVNEEVIFSITGLGKPDSIKAIAENLNFDEVLYIKGADVIKGFNDTPTRILNSRLSKKPYLIVYEWNINSTNKNKVLNYFCDNALCAIPDTKEMTFIGKNSTHILDLIEETKNEDYVLSKVLFNNCPNNGASLENVVLDTTGKKVKYCYDANAKTSSITKDYIDYDSQSTIDKGYTSNNKEIRKDITFGLNEIQNYPCNLAGDWKVHKKTAIGFYGLDSQNNRITERDYHICYKSYTEGKDTIELERPINRVGSSYKTVYVSEKTDGKCYGTTIFTTKPEKVIVTTGYGSSFVPVISGIIKDSNNNDINPLDKFVINIEDRRIGVGKSASLNMNLGLSLDDNNKFSYYCIDADNDLNDASEVSIAFYNDLNLNSTEVNGKVKLTANDTIKLYNKIKLFDTDTNGNKILKSNYKIISDDKPTILSKIIVKNKDNYSPVMNGSSQTNIDILNNNVTRNKTGNAAIDNGTINYKNLSKLANKREMCFIFDMSTDSQYLSSTSKKKLKPFNQLNSVKEKTFGMYLLTTEKCTSIIKTVDWTAIALLDNAPLTTAEQNDPNFVRKYYSSEQVERLSDSVVETLQTKNNNLCAVKIRCDKDYKYKYDINTKVGTCELKTTYTPNNFIYTEEYMINTGSGYKTVTIQVEDITKQYDSKTIVTNGVKIDNSFKATAVCDDGSKPTAGKCEVTKVIKAVCKKPLYYNGMLLDYKIDTVYDLQKGISNKDDAYVCTFIRPKRIQILKGVMPKLFFAGNNKYHEKNGIIFMSNPNKPIQKLGKGKINKNGSVSMEDGRTLNK